MPSLWPIPCYRCTRYHSQSVARIYISSNYFWPCASSPNKHSKPLSWNAHPCPPLAGYFGHFHPESQVVLWIKGTSVASGFSPRLRAWWGVPQLHSESMIRLILCPYSKSMEMKQQKSPRYLILKKWNILFRHDLKCDVSGLLVGKKMAIKSKWPVSSRLKWK